MLNLTRGALTRVIQFVQNNPEYEVYFRRALIPDESFFNSILANDPTLHVCNDVLRYIKWPAAIGASNVAVIGAGELADVLTSCDLFGCLTESIS